MTPEDGKTYKIVVIGDREFEAVYHKCTDTFKIHKGYASIRPQEILSITPYESKEVMSLITLGTEIEKMIREFESANNTCVLAINLEHNYSFTGTMDVRIATLK